MKTEQDINCDILKITMKIAERFPELSKYIDEMPVRFLEADDAETNIKSLLSYYGSLFAVLKNYALYHNAPSQDIRT